MLACVKLPYTKTSRVRDSWICEGIRYVTVCTSTHTIKDIRPFFCDWDRRKF